MGNVYSRSHPGMFRVILPLGIHGIPTVNGYLIAVAHGATLIDCGIWTGDTGGHGTPCCKRGWTSAASPWHSCGGW